MTVATTQRQGGGYLDRPSPSGLADVIEVILDKGLVIDIYVRVSLIGIEILTIDARIVIASVDTYLRFAEATNRLDLYESNKGGKDLPELLEGVTESGAKGKTSGMLSAAKEAITGPTTTTMTTTGAAGSDVPRRSLPRRAAANRSRD